MGLIYKSFGIDKKLHEDVMLLKIKTKAKSAREVMQKAIKLLKEHLKNDRN